MTVFVCGAEDKKTHIESVRFDVTNRWLFVDGDHRVSPSEIAKSWVPLEFKLHGLRRKNVIVQDVYAASTYSGMNLFVSEKARKIIDERFEGQCTFLPVLIGSMHYFALWANVTREDALDKMRSDLTEDKFGTKHLSSYVFDEAMLSGTGIFRLPPAYAGMLDLVTDEFVGAVSASELVGFTFWDRTCHQRA